MVAAALRDGPYHYLNPGTLSQGGFAVRARVHANAIQEHQALGGHVSPQVIASNPLLNPESGYRPTLRSGPKVSAPILNSPQQHDLFLSP